ncbi:helix-turn-helix domain-containing protein [Aquimarina mytili]|uniref:Helix-turn-helix transcriptional regulator n=1 Tax=Aquimarina mytili TaxID=874423 RepID=A0A936ZSK9_9FLAO|nr:helix-turn-helix domain-containing protein [Aquimarina mytili]MBL0683913.1 helix-turn-helix transcriptional regulator [Aquimarina mytili]
MLIDVNYFRIGPILKETYIPWQWLVAPMFYLFAYYFLNKESIDKKRLFVLIAPFFVITIVHSIQFVYHLYFNPEYQISNYYERGLFLYTNLISFVHIPGVIFFMYQMIISYEKKHIGSIEKIKTETTWLKNLIHIGVVIVSIGMLSAILGVVLDMKQSYYAYPFFISLSLWIYWVGYVGINRSSSSEKLKKLQSTSSSKKMGYDTFAKINEYIITEKKYLSVDINLNAIADRFEISNGYLSQLINANTNKSFNDHINELRVEAAKKMLIDKRYDNYTIESIGIECGFKSKSNFYSTFKKFSGQTPNQFKKAKK